MEMQRRRVSMYDADSYCDEEWIEDDGDPSDDVLLCPSCRETVHEDTQQCPHCGDWITPVYPGAGFRRLLWTVIVVLLVASLTMITTC